MWQLVIFLAALGLVITLVLVMCGKGWFSAIAVVLSNYVLGLGSLWLINYAAQWTSFTLPVNSATLGAAGILGLPGTLLCGGIKLFIPI
ncbi:MAG: pro-sigmaK processing inhibitor BofA family protein [Clostridia bacterium]|jgi:hypothetical protein|nr:pro-sigmaK processing inhibitor BofA family protein [Clostridia bacterium]MDD4572089.1 pro-sigmaK processing inhibitor BofA family protein [Clostridia bacterium]